MTYYAMAENREAYARWCNGRGVKQNHAVYVNAPERLAGRSADPGQFIFINGWEQNKRHVEIMAAYGHATLRKWKEENAPL